MGFLDSLKHGLERSREAISEVFYMGGEVDESFWEDLEDTLVMGDMGAELALRVSDDLRELAAKKGLTRASQLRGALADRLAAEFPKPVRDPFDDTPSCVLFVGINGAGKTTTCGKLAGRAMGEGKRVLLGGADTFRAAAIEQLQVWAERVGALFHARPAGSDPASVAYEAMDRALAEKVDILFVDTAGRLQTKVNLMEELTKIRQVLGKKHEGAPHRCILVIDATTGQNALSQAKLFKEAAGVDELILTKLDGTAKGGVAIAVAMQEKLPITYVGLGEKLEDLRPFNGADYARALLGDLDQGK